MRVRSNWVTICKRADGFVRAEAYRAVDSKKKRTVPFRRFCHEEAYGPLSASDRNLIPIENWKSSVLRHAIFMEMKTTDRTTHNDKQKSDFARVARPSNAFQIVAPHVIHILTYTVRARKPSTFYFCSRSWVCLLY